MFLGHCYRNCLFRAVTDLFMKSFLPVVAASLFSLLSVVILVVFIRLPATSLWRGFNLVYVPVEVQEELVVQALEKAGVNEVITLSNQMVPLVSPYAPVQSIVSVEYSYLQQRKNYFFDRSKEIQLYYIPSKFMERGRMAVEAIRKLPGGESAGIEGRTVYPWIVPLVVALVSVVLVVLSKARLFMMVAAFFPLLFTCCIPSYSSAGAVLLLLYGFYLCSFLWRRKDMAKAIRKSTMILLFGLTGVPIAFIGSWQEGLLFVLTMMASLCLCYILFWYSNAKSKGFVPVPIRGAQLVSVVSSVASFSLFIPAVAATILSMALFFFGYFPADTSINGLFLPAPARYTEAMSFDSVSFQDSGQREYFGVELPSLVHYVDWVWDTLTYPYRSLHETQIIDLVSAGETVVMPSYLLNDKDIIQEEYTPIYSLDDSFIKSVLEGIREDGFQIERVLKTQNCFTSVVYRRMGDFLGGKSQGQVYTILSLLATILISLVAGIFIWRIQNEDEGF